MEQESKPAAQELFRKAAEHGGFEYLYALVRVDGIQCYDGYKDELVSLRDWLKQPETSNLLEAYRFLVSLPEPLELIQNLINCANGKHYQVRAFLHLKRGTFPNAVWPTTQEKVKYLVESARASGFREVADQIEAAYQPHLLDAEQPEAEKLAAAFTSLSELLKQLLECHFAERWKFTKAPKYVKVPDSLDVLELITDEEFGLSGLRVHFSQNCTAEFLRTPKGVFGTNLEFGPPVTFLIMSFEPSTNEYRVNGKRLYEIGLPGRYNKLGEWKPLVYPGNAEPLINEAVKLSEDADVQGVLLYMRLTGHRCIEFALRTNIELPGDYTSTTERNLHIWKCPVEGHDATNTNVRVYDCWMELEGHSVEDVERGLSGIAYFVNVLCFPYGASYSWRNKYRMTLDDAHVRTPTHEDLNVVDSILKRFPETEDAAILVSGIDWYNRGSMSTNVFNRFLCYYVALEVVAVAIADGSDLRKTDIPKPTRKEKEACIEAKHSQLFATDPIRFVNESYFECVQSLTSRTKAGVASVFGAGHRYLKLLFEESSGGDISLKDLRARLAHGNVTLMHKRHEHLVRKHLHQIEQITKEFLLRVLFRLEPQDLVPSWSGKFQQSFRTADPRSTMVASTNAVFPKGTDWKIRAEWCE